MEKKTIREMTYREMTYREILAAEAEGWTVRDRDGDSWGRSPDVEVLIGDHEDPTTESIFGPFTLTREGDAPAREMVTVDPKAPPHFDVTSINGDLTIAAHNIAPADLEDVVARIQRLTGGGR